MCRVLYRDYRNVHGAGFRLASSNFHEVGARDRYMGFIGAPTGFHVFP